MLQWIAVVVFAGKRITRRDLRHRGDVSVAWLRRVTEELLIVRASELVRTRPGKPRIWKHGRNLRPRHLMRSILGARLRCVLRHKHHRAQIGALIAVLRDLDHYAELLAQRLRRRLTRLWPITSAPTSAAQLLSPPASLPAIADSS